MRRKTNVAITKTMIFPMRALKTPPPVEDVRVADAEADREDEVANQCSGQAEHHRHEPGLRPLIFLKASLGTSMRATTPQKKAQQERSDHDSTSPRPR